MPDYGAVGWKGFIRIGTSGNVLLPFTREDVGEQEQMIESPSIHGAGVSEINGVFGSVHHAARGQILQQGTISGDVFGGTGGYGQAFAELLGRAIGASSADHTLRFTGFTPSKPLVIAPAGETAFRYPNSTPDTAKCVIQRLVLNGGRPNVCNYQATILAANRTTVVGQTPTTSDLSYESDTTADDDNPVPYWSTAFSINSTGETHIDDEDAIVDWTIEINNGGAPIHTYNGSQEAIDITQGLMRVTGTFSYYSSDGAFVSRLNNGATLTLALGEISLASPYLFFGPHPIPNDGADAPVLRRVPFTCLAGGANLASLYASSWGGLDTPS